MTELTWREYCPKCGKVLGKVNALDESDTICPSCGVTVHWQGSTPWIEKEEK